MDQKDNGLLEQFLVSLESIGNRVEKIFSMFFEGILKSLEKVQKWLSETVKRIINYLKRLFKALERLLVNSFKLSLFYVPGIVLIIIGKLGTVLIGILYILLITAIGLTYGKKIKKKN